MSIVERFLADTANEDASLTSALSALDEGGHRQLAGVLARFDAGGDGGLGATERLLARRVLQKLRTVDRETLEQTNKVLDYLDLNADGRIDRHELELAVEVLEMFARVDSANDALSARELELLYAVLRHIDSDDSQRLEKVERDRLRASLADPSAFWARQKAENPRVQAILGR